MSRLDAETVGVLPEVVILAGGSCPCLATVGADLETLDGLVVVHDLHREPPLRSAFLVADPNGRGDSAGNELVRSADGTVSASDSCKGIGEEIEMALNAFMALVNNLKNEI